MSMVSWVAWTIGIAVVVLACRLPQRVLNVLMYLALALVAAWTLALFTV